MSEQSHHLLGAYLLGGLSPAERLEFEQHLHGCDQCRSELVQSASIPTLLGRAAGPSPAPSDAALPALLVAQAARQQAQRRRTLLVAAAAAACLLVGGGAAGAALDGGHNPAPAISSIDAGRTVTLRAAPNSGVTGRIQLTRKPWGTALSLSARGLPGAGTFTLRAEDGDGGRQQSAAWSATPDGTVTVVGATAIDPAALTALTVDAADGTVLAAARVHP